MKNLIIVILLAATVALGALCLTQRNKFQSQAAQLAQTAARLAAVEALLKEKLEAIENAAFAEARAKILQQTLTDTAAAAVEKTKRVEQLELSLADAKTNSPGNPLANMFKDPKMKELIKSQQKAIMGPMIEKNYAALFQQLNLTPEQAAQVKDLLQKKMLAGADAGMSMMGEDMDAAKRAELVNQIQEQNEAFDAQLKDLLGGDNYQSFETYEKSVPDRISLGQFRDQVAGTGTALSPAQEQQLIQALTEERSGFTWTTDYSHQNSGDTDFARLFNEDNLNRYAEERKRFDQQLLARAGRFLTPEQLKAFAQFRILQGETEVNGMRMAAQMFPRNK